MSENQNNLKGKRCPECGQDERFLVPGRTMFNLVDDGTTHHYDVEFDDDLIASCPDCGHEAPWREFDEDKREFMVFCRWNVDSYDYPGQKQTYISEVEAPTPEEAALEGRRQCMEDWGAEANEETVLCVGVIDIDGYDESRVAMWDDINGVIPETTKEQA